MAQIVADKLQLQWSPEQVADWLWLVSDETMERGKTFNRFPWRFKAVLGCVTVLVAQSDAANQNVIVRERQMLAYHLVIPGECSLGASVQALAPGGEQDVLDEHA